MGLSKNVLLVDRSARGHALADLFVRTNPDVRVFYGPGSNILDHPRITQIPSISIDSIESVFQFIENDNVDLVFVTCMDSLSRGFVNALSDRGVPVVGPSREAAMLEASKIFGKEFCRRFEIPTPRNWSFYSRDQAVDFIEQARHDLVVKEDGVKFCSDGVTVCSSKEEAIRAVDLIAQSGEDFCISIEERLYGEEVSITAFTDGKSCIAFPLARDFKRHMDKDLGVNCDGMGTVSPHPMNSEELLKSIEDKVFGPFISGIQATGLRFIGFVYFGGMITESGVRILEINARLGDSEAQVILPGVHTDFFDLCMLACSELLAGRRLVQDALYRCCIVATQGFITPERRQLYPGWPLGEAEYGQVVQGIDEIDDSNARIFFDGIERDAAGTPRTTRGRVLSVVGHGVSGDEAERNAYSEIAKIQFAGSYYRRDIRW